MKHYSFLGYPSSLWDFMKGCPNKAMDTHIYQAWNRPSIFSVYQQNACNFRDGIRTMEEQVDMPIIAGEWSLATDNCAMWLNGFNDNLPGFPKVVCSMWPCAEPYMGYDQPGCPPDKNQPLQGPYGTGVSGPQFGMCPVTVEWGSMVDQAMTSLALKHMSSFNSGHGWFFWNFRTELDPQWSYISSYFKGWFPANVSNVDSSDVTSACTANSAATKLAAIPALPQQPQQQPQQQQPGPSHPAHSTASPAATANIALAASGLAEGGTLPHAAAADAGRTEAARPVAAVMLALGVAAAALVGSISVRRMRSAGAASRVASADEDDDESYYSAYGAAD